MKRLVLSAMSRVGTTLSHRQRRFILDELHLGNMMGRLAENEFDEVSLPNGVMITINPLFHAQMADGGQLAYETDVLAAIEHNLAPGGTFYDVGANVGVFSFIAADRVGPQGAVCAFEPEENNLVCFRRTLQRSKLKNLALYDVAVGAADGTLTFDRRGGAFSGRLVASGDEARGATATVRVRSIDSLVRQGAPAPSLVKIDVEGGEGDVLAGMVETLQAHGPTVLCELHFFNREGVSRTLDTLAAAHYVCRDLSGKTIAPGKDLAGVPRHILAAPI